jgi:hypothetical protein
MCQHLLMITGDLPTPTNIRKIISSMPGSHVIQIQVNQKMFAVIHPTYAIQMAIANPSTYANI